MAYISIGYSWIPYSTDDGVLKFTGDERSRKELEKLLFSPSEHKK